MHKRILIIEPSRTIRTLLTIYFRNAGHQVIVLSNYASVQPLLPLFEKEPPEMVFVAVYPTQSECYQMLDRLRWLHSTVDTTLVALVREDESRHRNLQLMLRAVGATTLLKPFRIQEAMELVTPTLPPVVASIVQRIALS